MGIRAGYSFKLSITFPLSNSIKASLEKTMSLLLENTDITYKLETENIVVLVAKNKPIQYQIKKISGLVTDSKGQPIIGATIYVDRTA